MGDSLHLCHLASSEERRGTYLPESVNAYSVGLCHVHVVGESQSVQFSELAETPDRLASPSLPSFSFNISRVVLPHHMRLTADGQPVHLCVRNCAYLCVYTCV